MKNSSDLKWYATISIFLILLSVISYSLQIYIFHHESDTYFYLLQDISFVPIQVLIVTFFIDRLLKKQQRINVLKRVNVAIGIFFNELGNELLKHLFELTDNKEELKNKLEISSSWKINDFNRTEKWIAGNPVSIHVTPENVALLKDFFDRKRLFILNLLENSNLSEHDTFTDTLLAVSHLSDELALRKNLEQMPAADLNHLIIDMKRAYHGIIKEWILYMNHIKKEYPFLFSYQ
jgi:hypothetical protein